MKKNTQGKIEQLRGKVAGLRSKNSISGLSFAELIEFQNAKAALKRAESNHPQP